MKSPSKYISPSRPSEVWDAEEEHCDELISEAIQEDREMLSNCCGSPLSEESDVCPTCAEHAAAVIFDFTFPDLDMEYEITYDPLTGELISLFRQ